jgi:hypothetical protein
MHTCCISTTHKAYSFRRSPLQLNTYALSLLVKIAGTSTALSLMKSEDLLWLPVFFGLITHVLTIPLLMFCLKGPLVGITRISDVRESSSESYMHLMSEDNDDIEVSNSSAPETGPDSPTSTGRRSPVPILGSAAVESMQHFYRILPHCLLPCIVYMFRNFGESYRVLLPYWMSRRFDWNLREVGWVHLAETLFTSLIIALMSRFRKLFLPRENEEIYVAYDNDSAAQQHMQESKSTSAPAVNQDLSMTQICLAFSLLGSILMGMSWFRPSAFISLAILAVGMGFPDSYNSFLAGKMDEDKDVELQEIYMVSSIVGMVAARVGASVTSGIYAIALRVDGDSWATGTPLWVGAASFGVAWWMSRRHRL